MGRSTIAHSYLIQNSIYEIKVGDFICFFFHISILNPLMPQSLIFIGEIDLEQIERSATKSISIRMIIEDPMSNFVETLISCRKKRVKSW